MLRVDIEVFDSRLQPLQHWQLLWRWQRYHNNTNVFVQIKDILNMHWWLRNGKQEGPDTKTSDQSKYYKQVFARIILCAFSFWPTNECKICQNVYDCYQKYANIHLRHLKIKHRKARRHTENAFEMNFE